MTREKLADLCRERIEGLKSGSETRGYLLVHAHLLLGMLWQDVRNVADPDEAIPPAPNVERLSPAGYGQILRDEATYDELIDVAAVDAAYRLALAWAKGATGEDVPAAAEPTAEPARRPKRSTEKGEAREKLIAALTKHHNYADGSCLNTEPIGSNALAEAAVVSKGAASGFFKDAFGDYLTYRARCQDAKSLADALKAMRGEYTPAELSRMMGDAFQAGQQADE